MMLISNSHALGGLALLTAAVQAKSPIFVLSTANLGKFWEGNDHSLDDIHWRLKSDLVDCPTTNYILVSQPGVTAADYSFRHDRETSITALSRSASLQTSYISPNTRDSQSDRPDDFFRPLRTSLASICDADVLQGDAVTRDALQKPGRHIIEIPFKDVSRLASYDTDHVQQQLDTRDDTVSRIISAMREQDYTLIYYSTPSTSSQQEEAGEYIMDDDPVSHQLNAELKRDLSADGSGDFVFGSGNSVLAAATNTTLVDGPLFDRYQFFTPGLFMGFFAVFVLLMLLWIGITGLSSLKVTYAAFEKDQSQAGKKSQ